MTKFAEGYYLAKRVESDELTVIHIYEMGDPWSDEMEDRIFIETVGSEIPDVLSNYSWVSPTPLNLDKLVEEFK